MTGDSPQRRFPPARGARYRILAAARCSGFTLLCTGIAAGALCLGWGDSIQILDGPYDSLRYLRMAEGILQGQWLGPYDYLTLIRSPMYPLLLVLNALAGWRLHVTQQALYLAGILLLVVALRSLNVDRWRAGAVMTLCAFHPFGFMPNVFIATEPLYVPAATAVLAGCLGVLGSTEAGPWRYGIWVVVLSIATAVFWHTRPDNLWILPALAFAAGIVAVRCRRRQRGRWLQMTVGFAFPILAVTLVGAAISHTNQQYYGVPVVHELAEPNFVAAFRWLTRLAPAERHPYVPISANAFEAAYAVSPHFAKLRPFLVQQTDGKGWARGGCEWMGVCDELAGGWALWAVREAAAKNGFFKSGAQASAFFGHVARQVRQACKEQRVPCTRNPTGNLLAPPLQAVDLARIGFHSAQMAVLLATFGTLIDEMGAQTTPPGPHPDLLARYARITGDQAAQRGHVFSGLTLAQLTAYRYIQIFGSLSLFVGLWLRARGCTPQVGAFRMRPSPSTWIGILCCLLFVLGRILLIGYLDAMSFKAQIRYLLAAYPGFLTLMILSLPSFQLTGAFRYGDRPTPT